ncbi:MAG TPA: hypothetical protein PLE74_03105 [Candidatus Cloacimonadota bacterium]|nr:hypothetical protein [Candidatus Cloacimonadota bacterium]
MKSKILLILIVLVYSLALYAKKISIEILNCASDDNGTILVSKVRDLIRQSPAYDLNFSDKTVHYVLRIETMDEFKGENEGQATIFHYTILIKLLDGTYLFCQSRLGVVGKNFLNDSAEGIYTDFDNYIAEMNKP